MTNEKNATNAAANIIHQHQQWISFAQNAQVFCMAMTRVNTFLAKTNAVHAAIGTVVRVNT
jgi:hypothetical protein